MARKSLRFPLFWKILIGVLLLSGGLLFGSALFTNCITKQTQWRRQVLSRI